ncbi:hypothetical protein F0L16_03545 [Photorhabdus heterorhabditis]|uniref:Type VI secretion system tube protein Hcp n=1 Tax=Photorhabdus heterorhabditis TaxID=880156 RepID=A0A5B0X9T8_9GAMM|nr:hypothetical protein F0L16_03545 [Photorhabdus heterorhabditis]
MAIPVYLWLQDDGGSDIKGSVDVMSREGSIEVLELMHTVELPTDDMTGKITGKCVHGGFAFEKEIDSSSPYLYIPNRFQDGSRRQGSESPGA